MKLPSTTFPPFPLSSTPSLLNRLMTSPETTLLPAMILRPSTFAPAWDPFSSMMGLPLKPGWVEPSIVTGSETVGKAVEGVIVWSPEPGMLKTIVSAPGWALASRIACLSEPAPLSPALVTTNTDAGALSATASGLESASGTTGARMKPNTNGADSNTAALLVLLLIGKWMRGVFNNRVGDTTG
jgi:hypothetical protein